MRELADRFVPAADEVWRLQTGSDAECRFFQRIAEAGHYGGVHDRTRQGIYAVSPSGELLASINSTRPERVAAMLQEALEAWDALPDERRALPEDAEVRPDRRSEDRYPDDGLVLQVVSRDLGDATDPDAEPGVKWNRDYAWFTADELRTWLPGKARVGARFELPAIDRLVRFHLVDNVRGQVLPFNSREVEKAQLHAEVVAVQGSSVELRLTGETRAACAGDWHYDQRVFRARDGRWPRGLATTLLGRAVADLAGGRITELELVAVGHRWGRTRFNGRRRESGPSPVGFAITLASKTPAARVAPAFFHRYGPTWR